MRRGRVFEYNILVLGRETGSGWSYLQWHFLGRSSYGAGCWGSRLRSGRDFKQSSFFDT